MLDLLALLGFLALLSLLAFLAFLVLLLFASLELLASLIWTKSKRTAAFFRDVFPYLLTEKGRFPLVMPNYGFERC